MDACIIQSGKFISTAAAKTLQIRSGFDWIKVYNLTAINQAAADLGVEFYWQFGMPNGRGIFTTKLGSVANDPLTMGQIAVNGGFTAVDSAGNPLGTAVDTTSVANATQPVILTANTSGVPTGARAIIRVYDNENAESINGLDIYVTSVNNTSFTSVPVFAAGLNGLGAQAGNYRLINFDPLYYPSHRSIVKILANVDNPNYTDVTLSVPSGYVIGQTIRLIVPEEFGSLELSGRAVTITNVNDTAAAIGNFPAISITVDTSMAGVTAFTYPDNGDYPFSPALTVPVGENTAYAIQQGQNILSDATSNTGYIGVVLSAGINSPAGAAGDNIYWVAGKSSYTQNT